MWNMHQWGLQVKGRNTMLGGGGGEGGGQCSGPEKCDF